MIEAILHEDAKRKNAPKHQFHQYSAEQAKGLRNGSTILFVTRFGDVARAKVTSVKTWKTRPGDVDVSLKFGLYEFFVASYRGGVATAEQIVEGPIIVS